MSVFLTEGYEYFTGMLYVTFSSRPKEHFVILCALMPRVPPPSTSWNARSSVEGRLDAWLALHPWLSNGDFVASSHPENAVVDLKELISQKAHMNYPRFLTRLGQRMRTSVSDGKVLPNRAAMKYHQWRDGPSEGPEEALPACYRLVSASATTKKPTLSAFTRS